jgi:hypothetical protein
MDIRVIFTADLHDTLPGQGLTVLFSRGRVLSAGDFHSQHQELRLLLYRKRVDDNPICNKSIVVVSYDGHCLIICEAYTGRAAVSGVSTEVAIVCVNKHFDSFYMITYI